MTDQTGSNITTPKSSPTAHLGWGSYLTLCGLGLTLCFTWLGPSASEGLGTINRLLFWALHISLSLAVLTGVQIVMGRFGTLGTRPAIVQVIAAALIAAIIFTPVALVLDLVFPDADALEAPLRGWFVSIFREFAQLSVPFVGVWVLINTPSLLDINRLGSDVATGAAPSTTTVEYTETSLSQDPAEQEFWSRIPKSLGREMVAMTAELHYLRVYTTQGEALILFGFGRAVEMMDGKIDGFQLHRSHWVNLNQIEELRTSDRMLICRTKTGLELPVSRRKKALLKQAMKHLPYAH